MAAPKGNQYAVGNPNSGRPAIYDIEEMANKLDEWSKKYQSLALIEFSADMNIDPTYIYYWANKSEVFSETLRKAKARIAARRERMVHLNTLDVKVFNRYQGFYDPYLHQYEREEKMFDASLKNTQDNQEKSVALLQEIVEEIKRGHKAVVEE